MAAAGIVLVLSGLAFKIGAFPFQIWVPDVYQGAPTPVTALLAVASKAAGFVVLLVLVTEVFAAYGWLVSPVLTFMAAATILFGNLAALKQNNVKRLIGLSGVSHAGFILLAVASVGQGPSAVGAVYFYLIAYLIASFAVFGVMTILAGPDDTTQELGDYCGLARESPFLGGVLALRPRLARGHPAARRVPGEALCLCRRVQGGAFRAACGRDRRRGDLDLLLLRLDPGGLLQRRARDLPRDGAAGARGRRARRCASRLRRSPRRPWSLGFYQGPLGRLVSGQ